jgi:hypothetical protein
MTPEEIKSILESHKKWLMEEKGGKRADMRYADLSSANLRYADLSYADLSSANLSSANLRYANLRYADLRYADLSSANLRYADLRYADLSYAKQVEFINLPSIKMLASFELGALSDALTLELMRRDAWAHPKPELFDAWASGGACPYKNEDRYWLFELKKELWKPGPPEMRDSDLILAICRECGWKVNGCIAKEDK